MFDIAKHFMDRAKYKEAIFWYECAMKVPMNETSGAFIREDCYGYIPAIQLCVCWWRLGDKDRAVQYNELAGVYKPKSREVEQNRRFLK